MLRGDDGNINFSFWEGLDPIAMEMDDRRRFVRASRCQIRDDQALSDFTAGS